MQALRDRVNLSDLIGKRVKLSRAGREFKGCCPFHHEKTPSFYVNDEKQFYHCFGCGAHGDAVEFVMQHDNLSFVDAVELLAAEAGMTVPQQTAQDKDFARKQKDLYTMMDEAAGFFQQTLRTPACRDAYDYLTGRGMGDELQQAFRIGFAPADQFALFHYLKGKGYSEAQMIEAGLVRQSTRGTAPYAFFRDRVMFPVTDRRGRVVAFGGRILPEALRPAPTSGHKPPKYINSSETPLFHKGRMLYNESHARQAAGDGQPVIVVEGYVDVIACFAAGYRGAVAPLGTALTADQIMALWKMIPQQSKVPILCFDGDEAGRRAAARACENILPLLQPDHSAAIAFLPEGQDPDSLLRGQGKKAFEPLVAAALPLADFIWQHHTGTRHLETPEQRAGLAKALEDEAAKIPDRTVQQYYRQQFRDRLYHAFRPPRASYGGAKGARFKGPVPVQVRNPAYSRHLLRQQILLTALLNHPALFNEAEEALSRMKIPVPAFDALRQELLAALENDPALDSVALQSHLNSRGYSAELEYLLSSALYTHAGFARPGADADHVAEGWHETLKMMQQEAENLDFQQMVRALTDDFSADNEQKVMALYQMKVNSEG